MRKRHRDSLKQTQDELRQRLDDNKTARNESVENMRNTFREARQEVANDLRAASNSWHEFTASRHGAEPRGAAVHHAAVVETVEPAAPQHGKKTQTTTKPKGRRK
jgi:hypothetical protein